MAETTTPDTAPHGKPPHDSPILGVVAEFRSRMEAEAARPGGKLTCEDLVRVIGADSHVLGLLIFSLLNTLPAPPGYNFVMGLLMTMMAMMVLLGACLRNRRSVEFWGEG